MLAKSELGAVCGWMNSHTAQTAMLMPVLRVVGCVGLGGEGFRVSASCHAIQSSTGGPSRVRVD